MSSAEDIVGQLVELPEQERTLLVMMLLEILEGPELPEGASIEELRARLLPRVEIALAHFTAGGDWSGLREWLARAKKGD